MTNENLVGYIKITAQNLRTLHRHLKGGQWFEDHEKLGEYYDKIDDMEDNVVETMLSLGLKDISVVDAAQKYNLLKPRSYTAQEAFPLVKGYFEKLNALFIAFKREVKLPDSVKSKFEEYEYWLHLESKYKLAKMLETVDLGNLFEIEK